MIDHDRLFKELISTFFVEFIDLFFPQVRDYIEDGVVEFLDKEIFTDVTFGERREVDLVAKLRFRGEETCFLVHVENQAQAKADFGERMFTYFARLHEKHRMAVYPIAVFTFDAPQTEQQATYLLAFPDRVVLEFRFQVVQLNRLNWRDFVRRENPVASALMAKMKIAPDERARVRLECIRLLTRLKLDRAKTQVILGFVDTYLRLSRDEAIIYQTELEKLAPGEKERMMEVTILWKEEGRQEGLVEGMEQGMQQGMLAVITHQLERRLGPLDVSTRDRLGRLDSAQLERLAEELLDFADAEDLSKWFARS